MKSIIEEYSDIFNIDLPILNELIKVKELQRLKDISYHCGMYYGPKDIYDIKECYSRLDHSINGAKFYYILTNDINGSVAFLLHDISSPVFSHVIDFMENDPINQEITEELNEKIIRSSKEINEILKKYNINIEDVVDLKKYPIGDNKRPKLCIDRLDAVLVDSLLWNPNITIDGVKLLLNNITVFINEDLEQEIGFKDEYYGKIFMMLALKDAYKTDKKDDTFAMNYLGSIVKLLLDNSNIRKEDLYTLKETGFLRILQENRYTKDIFNNFLNLTTEDIKESNEDIVNTTKYRNLSKKRYIIPIVNGKRITDINCYAKEILNEYEIFFLNKRKYVYIENHIRK